MKSWISIARTLAGAICLCGHCEVLPFPAAVDPLFLEVFWKEASRASYVKYWSIVECVFGLDDAF